MLSPGVLDALADAVWAFTTHVADVLFAEVADDGPDGDLGAVGALLEQASEIGLLADAPECAPEDDWGVWGDHVITHGCGLDLANLATLATACAGLGAAVHAHGIARLAVGGHHELVEPGDRLAAVFVPAYGVALDPRTRAGGVRLTSRGLSGASPFVWSTGEPDALVVAAHDTRTDDWAVVVCPTTAGGVHVESAGRRVGLRATSQFRVDFDDVEVDADMVVATGDHARHTVDRVIACDWLGCAALALGTARAAYDQAVTYSAERHQGGGAIIDHAAVRLLLAGAAHHIDDLDALLRRHADVPLADLRTPTLLTWAISTRLGIAEHAVTAVTDSLQTHGGYGYMDDYGLSKRLRDAQALALRHGSRDQLLLARHALATSGFGAR